MNQDYTVDNIKHLEIREAIRSRISMYLGSATTDGIYQALKEIINNSTDEALAGFGNRIGIKLDESNNMIEVSDIGRGVPFGIKDGRNVLVAVYTEAHTGGKFDKDSYKNSSGLNGIGGTAVCMSSEHFTVKSFRNNIVAEAVFEKGNLISYNEKSYSDYNKTSGAAAPTSGTIVTFNPDKEVFNEAEEGFSYERICNEVKNIAYLNKGVHFIVETAAGQSTEFYSENGIADFIKEKAQYPLMKAPIIATEKDETDELEIAFIWTAGPAQEYVFVNGLLCPQLGTPATGAKTKITTKIKALAGKSFSPDSIRKGLVYAINCKVANPSFSNQSKNAINNTNLRGLASKAFDKGLEEFSHTPEFESIIESIAQFEKAEAAAEKARLSVLTQNKEIQKELKKKVILADKLVDCRKHDENSMLFVVEGEGFALTYFSTYQWGH